MVRKRDIIQANAEDALLRRLAAPAVREAAVVGQKIQRKIGGEMRKGERLNVAKDIGSNLRGLQQPLEDTLLRSHLVGMGYGKTGKAAQTKDWNKLANQAGLSDTEFWKLRKQYRVEAQAMLKRAENFAADRMQKAAGQVILNKQGKTQAVTTMREAFANIGLTPEKNFMLETLMDAGTRMGFNAGKGVVEDADEGVWGYMVVTMRDELVRPTHRPLDGVTLPKGAVWWRRNGFPLDWGCRCRKIALAKPMPIVQPYAAVVAGEGFRFDSAKVFKAEAA